MMIVRKVRVGVGVVLSLALATAACSKKEDGGAGGNGRVMVTARFKNGAGGVSSFAATGPAAAVVVSNGNWFLSPDRAVVRFHTLTFDGSNTADLGDSCEVTFDRSQASGSSALDCPILISNGTFRKMSICFDQTVDMLIDDPSIGLYTDPASPTLLSTTPPAGGAAMVPFVVGSQQGDACFEIALPQPLVVADSSAGISIIADLNKTVRMSVTGGVPTLATPSDDRPVAVAAVPGDNGSAEFYDNSPTYRPNIPNFTSVGNTAFARVFFASPTQPVAVMVNTLCPSTGGSRPDSAYAAGRSAQEAIGFFSGAYLGLDPAGDLAWAIPADEAWTSAQTYVMDRVTTLGSSGTVVCGDGPEIVPTSGETYASGAPSIASPAQTTTVYLHAR